MINDSNLGFANEAIYMSNINIQQVLKHITNEYGKEIYNQPKMLLSYFCDIAPELLSERQLIKICVEAQVFQEAYKLRFESQENVMINHKKLAKRLNDKYYISEDIANEIVGYIINAVIDDTVIPLDNKNSNVIIDNKRSSSKIIIGLFFAILLIILAISLVLLSNGSNEKQITEPINIDENISTVEPSFSVVDNTSKTSGVFYPEKNLYCEPYECYAYCYELSVQNYVKMRCGPDKNKYDISVNRIENNTKVTVLSEDLSGWKLCSYEGQEGWIRSDFLFREEQPCSNKLFVPGNTYNCNEKMQYAYCIDTNIQNFVKVRYGPSKSNYDVIKIIDNNTQVTVKSKSCEGWTLCEIFGDLGWIRSDFLFDSPQ